MVQHIVLTILVASTLIMPAITTAGDMPSKKGATVNEVKAMSEKDQTALALSGAPAHIAKEAGIMIYGTDGKLTETKKSANGFTCIPTVMNLPYPDPMCMDAAVQQWMTDHMNGAPKPTNTVPGIAYMARGGSHFEKDWKVGMSGGGGKILRKTPHWVGMWAFDRAGTKVPHAP